jgi:ABC-type transporter Mla MlaB component
VSLYIGRSLDSSGTVFHLEGWLEGEAVAELQRVALVESAGPIRLDLSGLRSADVAGLNALRALRTTGATLVGASPYIRLLLGR